MNGRKEMAVHSIVKIGRGGVRLGEVFQRPVGDD
jgi:hypothetical protein